MRSNLNNLLNLINNNFLIFSSHFKSLLTPKIWKLREYPTRDAVGQRSKEEIALRAPENESNVLNKYFHFRYNLHETSCERSLGSIWILEKYGKGPVHTYPVFRLKTESFFLRFGLPSIGMRWKRSPKTCLFKNALQCEDFWKCSGA